MTSSALFRPLQLGPLTLPNRMVMAPMTRSRAYHGRVGGDAQGYTDYPAAI